MSPTFLTSSLTQHHDEEHQSWPPNRSPERRASIQSTTSLPSPSLVAARAYYLQTITPIGQKGNALQRRRSLFEVQQIPRRHSAAVPRPEDLVRRVETLNVVSGARTQHEKEHHVENGARTSPKTEGREDRDIALTDAGQEEFDEAVSPTQMKSKAAQELTTDILRPAPFQFTHERLREWGPVFLCNQATADAFINAVSLCRPKLILVKEKEANSSRLVTIRARIFPKSKERKPLLIQKDFDVSELRASIAQNSKLGPLRRSTRVRRSSRSMQSPRRNSTDRAVGALDAVPIRMCLSIYPKHLSSLK
jgi:hypothetical protein